MKTYLTSVLLLFSTVVNSQGQQPVLDEYIRKGLNSNQALKQRRLEYTSDLMALREAKGLFFPDVSLNARYTVAEGGRIIEFPVGDLLNPVYSTLNLLTASQDFPAIENESFRFYRPKEHESKVSVVQPIFSMDLIHNVKIKRDAAEISSIDVSRYKRELILEITRAYYNYQKAYYLTRLADTTMILINENIRVSRSLYENDLVTIDKVYRSEAEKAIAEAELAKARNRLESSRAYFNFLLNRNLEQEIILSKPNILNALASLPEAQQTGIQNREELDMIREYQSMNQQVLKLQRGKNLPGLFGMVDYGFQGEEYRFTSDDDFVLASLVLKWDLFQGMVNHAKIQQTKIEGEKLKAIFQQSEQQIKLEVINSYYALQAAYDALQARKKQQRSAKSAYRLIRKKYAEGQASLLELIDARTSMTGAASAVIIAENEYFICTAELEYATGIVDLDNY
ncbi:MAG: TolC family protein [Bacteroidales bacterium]|nr:TolC family protein [Bacteroidales bacterium]